MGELSITVVDILVVLIVLVSAGYAVYRGLIRETLSVFAWLVSAYLMLLFAPMFSNALAGAITNPWIRVPIAYVAVFLAMFIPLSYLAHNFRQSVKKTAVGPVDRTLGFVFGVGRGVVVIAAVYLVFAAFVPLREQPSWLTEARLYPLVQNTGGALRSLVPGSNDVSFAEIEATATARQPAPAPELETAPPNYGQDERQELDRLIQSTGEQ
jgi:membrane protein required for colicin V production